MATSTEEMTKLRDELKTLEVGQATQVASMAGAQTTQAAAQAGTWSTMLAGAVGFVVGIFLALSIVKTAQR